MNTTAGCDLDCRKLYYCQTVSNDIDEWDHCMEFSKFDWFNKNGLFTLENLFNHDWY